MNKQHKTGRFALHTLAIIGGLAVASTASAKNPKEVDLEIVDNKLVITTSKKENNCTWPQKRGPGCIKVLKGKKSEIYFHLKGDTKCTLDYGTKWELNAVYLGGFDSPSKPAKSGFDTTSAADYKKVNDDFNIVDRKSGQATLIEKSEKKLAINDENQNKYIVWYKIEAICKRSDGNPTPYVATSDPRVRNGGTD